MAKASRFPPARHGPKCPEEVFMDQIFDRRHRSARTIQVAPQRLGMPTHQLGGRLLIPRPVGGNELGITQRDPAHRIHAVEGKGRKLKRPVKLDLSPYVTLSAAKGSFPSARWASG